MKKCSKCKIEKDESLFVRHKQCKGGIAGYCKECEKKLNHAHYEANKERITKQNKEYIESHPEVRKKALDNYYSAKKEDVKKRAKVWAKQNLNKRRAISLKFTKKYRKEHPDKVKKSRQKWYSVAGKAKEKRFRDQLADWYVVKLIKQQGREHLIEPIPTILDLKKLEIIIHRFNKMKNEGKFSNPDS